MRGSEWLNREPTLDRKAIASIVVQLLIVLQGEHKRPQIPLDLNRHWNIGQFNADQVSRSSPCSAF
jgi:hypothetical protein